MKASLSSTLTTTVICILLGLGTLNGIAGDKKISKKDVPGAVLTAFEKKYPNATIKAFLQAKEKRSIFYEIESLDGKVSRDLLYKPDGTIVEMEESVSESELPQSVRDTLAAKYPKGAMKKIERLTRDTMVTYEVHLIDGKKSVSLELASDGKIISSKTK